MLERIERTFGYVGHRLSRRRARASGHGFLGGLTFTELAKKTWSEASKDEAMSHAAELAFYFLLAFFPLLIFLISILGFSPSAQDRLVDYLAKTAPPEATVLLRNWVSEVASKTSGSLLSFSLLGSLFAASSGMAALMRNLNITYGVEESRPWWKSRLVAVGLVLALGIFVIGGALLIMFGDALASALAYRFGLGDVFAAVWPYVDYLIGLALLIAGMGMIYHFAPNAEQRLRWIAPGAVFAVVSAVIASFLFSIYLRYAPSFSRTYGSLGAMIVFMLWLYILGL
ncbi:MAG TPA: YihY/virulence factor BrkB family protein, partial [Blastocatellia bacterium]